MKLKDISSNIKKLLEYKSVDYKRKYFILSNFFDTNILDSNRLNEEFNCYLNSLNYSNGKYPNENDLIDFYKQCLQHSNNSKSLSESKIKFIKKYNDLRNPKNKKDIESLINESLDNTRFSNKEIDKKLGLTLKESIKLKKSILIESEYASKIEDEDEDKVDNDKDLSDKKTGIDNVIDFTKMFDEDPEAPTSDDLQKIDSLDVDLDDTEPEDEDESPQDKSLKEKEASVLKEYDWLLKKESIPFIRNRLNFYLPIGSDADYIGPNLEKIPVKDQLAIISLYKLIVEQNASNAAMRKWNIIHKIRYYLNIQQKLMYGEIIDMGEKSLSKDMSRYTSGPTGLSYDQKSNVKSELNKIISKINKNHMSSLDSSEISERRLIKLLRLASGNQSKDVDIFVKYLDVVYPDSESHEIQDVLSSDEYDEYEKQNLKDEERASEEDQEIYGNELDLGFRNEEGDWVPGTGQQLYADEDVIANIKQKEAEEEEIRKQKEAVIEVDEVIENASDNIGSITMTSHAAKEFGKELDKDMKRMYELIRKATTRINPEIFSEIKTDSAGNMLPDIENIPSSIPAENLTDSEVDELIEIFVKLDKKKRIVLINYDKKGNVYNKLIENAVSVDEYISYMKNEKLETTDEPRTWKDIVRSSYGAFKGEAGARQLGMKAWMKELFYSSDSDKKSNIYANLADRWYERLIVLDLIDDKSFVRMPIPSENPDEEEKENIIPYSVLKSLEDKGKYTRSKQLKDVSDMLDLVFTYTADEKYVKRYFDLNRGDNLDKVVEEKIEKISTYASSDIEFDVLLKQLAEHDKDTAAYAILDSMFEGNSGFRYYATGLLKEYYNDNIWPEIELHLAQGIKKYFDKYYGVGLIAASLGPNEGSDKVKSSEGKVLFNKIIYLVMERVGIKSGKNIMPDIGSARDKQREYFLGNADPRGDFAATLNKWKDKYDSDIEGISSPDFGPEDVNMLLDDMFSSSGIIGSEYTKRKRITGIHESEITNWILEYPESKLDQAIILGMSLSDFFRRTGSDVMITQVIKKIAEDTEEAYALYKEKFGSLLAKGTDLANYLDLIGYDPPQLDPKDTGKPDIKNFM